MGKIAVSSSGEFSLGGINFVIERRPGAHRASDSLAFTIDKHPFYLGFYEDLASSFSPRSILELGIFEGGSYVLLDKLFHPRRMAAVDIAAETIVPLAEYCARSKNRFVHFATSQTNAQTLGRIVRDELAAEVDLVVDDASHTYEDTKASFEFLFPLMRPGGVYVIEDWSWAHRPDYQSANAPFAKLPALSNLLFELIMLHGSTAFIAEIRIWKPLCMIRKGPAPAKQRVIGGKGSESLSVFDQILSRGKRPTLI